MSENNDTHHHSFTNWASRGRGRSMVAIERCKCGQERERPATAKERRENAEMWRRSSEIHKTWHALTRKFYDQAKREWLLEPYELMCAIEKWAKRRPEIKIVGVDDSHFASSSLVLVPHALDDEYMGTTVLYIPQCSGEKPIEFFMYPSHRSQLLTALSEMEREHGLKKGWGR